MNKKKWIRIVSIYSITYTAITLLNSVLYLCNGIYEDPGGNWHELDRAIILLIGIAAFELCTNLPVKPLALRYLLHIFSLSCWRSPMSGSADCRNLWRKQRTGIYGLTLRAFLCCYVSSILSFMFLRKREGRRRRAMSKYNTLWEYVRKAEK